MPRAATWICLIAIVILGFGLRVYGLNNFYFSPDDLLILEIASGESLQQVWRNGVEHTYPPLLYWLLHFVEKVILDATFFRYFPLLSGVALIFASFYLGRVVSGEIAGIAMAFLAASSVGSVIQSQVIRPYCLLAFLLTVGLTEIALYQRYGRTRSLIWYGVVTVLGVLLHYGSSIQLLGVSAAWAGHLALNRASSRKWAHFLAASLPPFAILATLYLLHLRTIRGLYTALRQSYLKVGFPTDMTQFWSSVRSFFELMLLPDIWWLALLLVPIGVCALWRKSHTLALAVLLTAMTNLVLMGADRYPFGGSRHSFVLFPVFALTMGCAIQYLFEAFSSRPLSVGAKKRRWRVAHSVFAIGLLISVPLVWTYYGSREFMRTSRYGGAEFPVRWNDYRGALARLRCGIGARDVVLANRQTGHYLLFEAGYSPSRVHSYRSDELFHFTIDRVDGGHVQVYVAEAELNFRDAEALTRSLAKLAEAVEVQADTNVWVANFGWDTPIERIRETDPIYAELAEPVEVARGVQLYRLSGRAVQTLLDR